MADEFTDGNLHCWPVNVEIVGNNIQGWDVRAVAYTIKDDVSAPFEIAKGISNCEKEGFKTKMQARKFAERCGFVPNGPWGTMDADRETE